MTRPSDGTASERGPRLGGGASSRERQINDRSLLLRRRIGLALGAQRRRLGLTQEEAAEGAALSLKYYGEIERGECNATLQSLEQVVAVLNWDPVTLFAIPTVPMTTAVRVSLARRIDDVRREVQLLTDFVAAFDLTGSDLDSRDLVAPSGVAEPTPRTARGRPRLDDGEGEA